MKSPSMNKTFYTSKSHVLGAIAQWAVRQSPYDVPENLDVVLHKAATNLTPFFTKEFESMTYQGIQDMVRDALRTIPEYLAWNERKNGSQSLYKFVSRYGGDEDPDDDFIDLGALERNVANSIIREGTERGIQDILNEEIPLKEEE